MLQTAGSQDPPAKVSLGIHEVTAVKSFANINFDLPVRPASCTLSHGIYLWPCFLFFSSAPAFGCCSCWSSPYRQEATCPCQMGTGLNGPLVQAKRATSLQGPTVQTLRPRLSLEGRHLDNTSALENVLNP